MASKYSITDMLGRVLRAITLGTDLNTPGSVTADSGGFPIKAADTPTQTLTINSVLPRSWRILYTIGGTTPSFTISSVQVNYVL